MGWIARVGSFAKHFLHRRRRDDDLDAELRSVVDLLTEQKMREGMGAEAARRAARIELGGVEQVKESVREARAGAWLDTLGRDVRYGLRTLRKNPGFTAVAVLTLALGIGANSTIFSWINSTVLNPIPGVTHTNEYVVVATGERAQSPLSYRDYIDLRDHNHFFSNLIATDPNAMSLTTSGKPERVWGMLASANYFDALGVRPVLGRGFLPEEDAKPNGAPVVVISYQL